MTVSVGTYNMQLVNLYDIMYYIFIVTQFYDNNIK